MGMGTGAKYEAGKNITEIAKCVREEIKAAVKKKEIPALKYSVRISRYSGGQSLRVSTSVGEPTAHTDECGRYRLVPKYAELREKLSSIVDEYRRDDSDSMTDYFSCNFYSSIDIDE